MAIRRLNYTGRKRLNQEHTRFVVYETGKGFTAFNADLNLASYGLPGDALVSVEAYRQTSWMRFPFGTVNNFQPFQDRRLTEFDTPEGILFRVRITSPAEPQGLLLAEADRIRPRSPEEVDDTRISLLPVKPDDDLDDQVFRVDFVDRPLLLVNTKVGDWRSVARDPVFVALAFPSALREILTRVLYVERHYDVEDMTDWRSQWLRFSALLPGVISPPSEDEEEHFDDWINEAVAAFCRRFGVYERFGKYWTEEGMS